MCTADIAYHRELGVFFITPLPKESPIIYGLPWLQCHDPLVSWAGMEITFDSQYCREHCLPLGAPSLTVPSLPRPTMPSLRTVRRRPVTIEEVPDEDLTRPQPAAEGAEDWTRPLQSRVVCPVKQQKRKPEQRQKPESTREQAKEQTKPSLHPRLLGCRVTQALKGPSETRAAELPSRPRTPPLRKVAGALRPTRLTHRTRFFVGLTKPKPLAEELDMDIRMIAGVNFSRFCKHKDAVVSRYTWDELLKEVEQPEIMELPQLTEEAFRRILLSQGTAEDTKAVFPPIFHEFIDECYQPDRLPPVQDRHLRACALRLCAVSDEDIDKYLEGKAPVTDEDIKRLLPRAYHHLKDAFSPQVAAELPPHRPWDHKIELIPGKQLPYHRNRPHSPRELEVIRGWIHENLDKGFIRRSSSPAAAPVLLAKKPGGGVRICVDYRGLNNATVKNRYPIPLIRETLYQLGKARIFTKLDVIAAFNRLRIAEGHEWKTAFITRLGLFETLVANFGMSNAPASFQQYINHALGDALDYYASAYLDDVIIYSANQAEHRRHVATVIQRLRDAGLQIDIRKSEFDVTKTKYLGLIVGRDGIEMDQDKVDAVLRWGQPKCLKDVQRFLGFANFYRRFILGFSKIAKPLNELARKGVTFRWEREQETAFEALKQAFAAAPVLAHFDYDRKSILEADASDWASGGVLSQYDDQGVLKPVAFFSARHTAQECNYEIYDKELLAILKCLEEWRPELEGSKEPVEVITDHKNLQYFTTTKELSPRQMRWSEFLSRFNFQIVYRPGLKAAKPDALSRLPGYKPSGADERLTHRHRTMLPRKNFDESAWEQLNEDVDINLAPAQLVELAAKSMDELVEEAYRDSGMAHEMVAALQDPAVRRWPKNLRQELRVAMTDCRLERGRIYYKDRLFLPPVDELRIQAIFRTHSTGPGGHPGRLKTTDLMARTYWWPRMTIDVAAFVRACELCFRTKTPRSSPPGFLKPLPIPFKPWKDISVDYVTPLPACKRHGREYKHILVVVCRLTKMRHFIPTVTLEAEELAEAFIGRIYSLHGCPDTIVSDRGSQFISRFWRCLSDRLSIALNHSSAYHPQTDGQTEIVNAAMEQYLRAFCAFQQDDWVDWLPLAEFAANNQVSETTGVSPFYANYGFHPRIGVEPSKPCPTITAAQRREFFNATALADRFERILTRLRALARSSQERYERNANASRDDHHAYEVGDLVWVDIANLKTNRPVKKLDDKWAGPYPVVRVGDRTCTLELPREIRIFPTFHVSKLRPYEKGKLPGQDQINKAERQRFGGKRVLERQDGAEDQGRWEIEGILDCHNEDGLHYLVKWSGAYEPTWQPAEDLKGSEETIRAYHKKNPTKPGMPEWARAKRGRPRRADKDHPRLARSD